MFNEEYNCTVAEYCDAEVDKSGGNAWDDWKGGKPVRAVRSSKAGKHSQYAKRSHVQT